MRKKVALFQGSVDLIYVCCHAGDAASWSLLMQRLVLTCHYILDGLFLGLEDGHYAASSKQAPHPPHTRPLSLPPPPLPPHLRCKVHKVISTCCCRDSRCCQSLSMLTACDSLLTGVLYRASFPQNVQPLGGDVQQWSAAKASGEKYQSWLLMLGTLMDCMEHLLTDAQPWPVALPGGPIFMLMARILSFSSPAASKGTLYAQATVRWQFT